MKKGKILAVGLIALLMAGALFFAGCEEDPPVVTCPNNIGDCYIAEGDYSRTRYCNNGNSCSVNWVYSNYWSAPYSQSCDC